ncbi:NrdH-redoxin [Candidatus Peregrinibacteria bacterium CG11_big_fil_rev_8_21_14_0_20_46_8]|nr:MAG: NrdH-redoxin [Candidatus Peregrinibacteria bacterium CG11_big_fil_rev_8_21_14_0_20_46_8]
MKTITIYKTPTCGFCKMLKAFLDSQSIEYVQRDVVESSDARDDLFELVPGNMSVPVIVLNKGKKDQEILIGFDQEKLEAALGLDG